VQVPVGGGETLAAVLKGMTGEDIAAKFGKGTTWQMVLAAEEYHYATAKGKMRAWLDDEKNAKPESTFEDRANAYRMSLVRPYWELAAANSVTNPEVGKPTLPIIVTQDEYDKLPSGAHYRDGHDQERTKP